MIVKCLTLLCYPIYASELLYLYSLDRSISNRRDVYITLLLYFTETEFNANGLDPDQAPRSMASDLGLHCFPMPISWDARHK